MKKIENIKYFNNIKIGNLSYSIDMLHIEFASNIGNKNDDNNSTKSIIRYILMKLNSVGCNVEKLRRGEVGTYIENIEPNLAKRKFYSYRSLISYDGITLLIGKFFRNISDDVFDCESCVRLIYNPNKHQDSEFLKSIITYLSSNFTGRIIKYDLAIDVPDIEPCFVDVFTKKLRSTIRDTQYYGSKQRHGYIKIYNKSKEAKIEDKKITRIEFTLRTGQPLPTDEILIPLNTDVSLDFNTLSKQCINYILMINDLKNFGCDWKRHFDNLDSRTRKKIEPFVVGSNKKLVLDNDIITKLLSYFCDVYSITQQFDSVNDYEFELDELDDEIDF